MDQLYVKIERDTSPMTKKKTYVLRTKTKSEHRRWPSFAGRYDSLLEARERASAIGIVVKNWRDMFLEEN